MTTVTDADREAAAAYYYSAGGGSRIARLIREGHRDDWFRVQAFARHREHALASQGKEPAHDTKADSDGDDGA
jgi:hypothetical protein